MRAKNDQVMSVCQMGVFRERTREVGSVDRQVLRDISNGLQH